MSATFTIAYAKREQEAEVPKGWGLARVKSILAASTRQDWEADGPRLWARKGDPELRIVDLTDDEGRVELEEGWANVSPPLTMHRSKFVPRERCALPMRCGSTTSHAAIWRINALPGRQSGKENER